MRVVIGDDSVLLREGIARLLREEGIDVVEGAGDALELIAAVERQLPDLAIIDVRMPPTYSDEGLRAAIEIRRRWPQVALLVLSQFVEERYASELLAGETSGIGYLLKDRVGDIAEFVEVVHRVASGGAALDPDVVRQLLARSNRTDPLGRLTPREREVLSLMAQGKSNNAIAEGLVVSVGRSREARDEHLHEVGSHPGRRSAPSSSHGSRPLPRVLIHASDSQRGRNPGREAATGSHRCGAGGPRRSTRRSSRGEQTLRSAAGVFESKCSGRVASPVSQGVVMVLLGFPYRR